MIKIPEKIIPMEETFILAHVFRGSSPQTLGSAGSGSVVRQTHHGRSLLWGRVASLTAHGKQRVKKGLGTRHTFWGAPPVAYFLQLAPFPKVPTASQ